MTTMTDSYHGPVPIEIDRIDTRPASQMRDVVNADVVDEYAENFDHLPPIRVMADIGDTHWLVDGSYRLQAATKLGKRMVMCLVKSGTYLDAFAEASRSNDTHGVRVTNADKRKRVEEALKNEEMRTWSARKLGDHCGVSYQTVINVMPDVDQVSNFDTSPAADPPRTIGKDGKSYPARKRRGRKPAESKPESNGKHVDAADIPPQQPAARRRKRAAATIELPPSDGCGPEPATESASDTEEGPDWDAWWAEREQVIRAMFLDSPEDVRSFFAMQLSTLARVLKGLCPDITSRTNVPFS